jgi:hypothetical protein
MIKKFLVGAAMAASMFAMSAHASATLTNWYIDTDGAAGAAGKVKVTDYLDLNGQAYVHNEFTSATTYNFNEAGTFLTVLADGTKLLTPALSSTFTASGTGDTNAQKLSFTSGLLTVYSGTTAIATFELLTGSANLAGNTTLPNNTISLIFKAVTMLDGYFFDSSLNDLSSIVNSPEGLVMGFATTNAVTLTELQDPSGVLALYNDAFADISGPLTQNGTTDLFLSNNGQFRMSVPEPSTLSLFGLALVGFGFSARRKSKV